MKLSTKSRYAIRALLDLIIRFDEKPVSIRDIAESQNVSVRYLENIFYKLKRDGILGSIKGKNGGFIPGANIREVSVLSIIEILEGRISVVNCTDFPGNCSNSSECSSRFIWKKLNDRIRETLEETRLFDLIEESDSEF